MLLYIYIRMYGSWSLDVHFATYNRVGICEARSAMNGPKVDNIGLSSEIRRSITTTLGGHYIAKCRQYTSKTEKLYMVHERKYTLCINKHSTIIYVQHKCVKSYLDMINVH